MGRVSTNNTVWKFAEEDTPGVLPVSPVWRILEPEDIPDFGAEIETVAREPISLFRQRRKGVTVGLESGFEIEHDLTYDLAQHMLTYWMYAAMKWGYSQDPIRAGATPFGRELEASASPNAFTHTAITAALAAGTLVYVRGMSVVGNNGLMLVGAASTTTQTNVSGTTLVDETPTAVSGARLEIAGVRAGVGDLVLTVTGTVGTLASTTLDFTDLDLQVGQFIHIGGLTSANWFGATNRGYVRVTAIAANLLTFDKADSTLVTDPGTGDTVDLLFSWFLRNVQTTSADFREDTIQIEASLPNLGSGGATRYEYALGNQGNVWTLDFPLKDKSTATFGMEGTDTEVPTGTAKTNSSSAVLPVGTNAYGTAKNIARLRLAQDVTGLTTCFQNVSLKIDNQATPEACLGVLGSAAINTGTFLVDVDTEAILTDETVISAIRNNTTMTLDLLQVNEDGALFFDLPSMTLGGGKKEFPKNESVKIAAVAAGFGDPIFGYTLGISGFAAVPQPV
jgi:hypothetical protein